MKSKLENRIRRMCLKRIGKNLAAVLVFGSYRTGPYTRNQSDVDLMILLKNSKGIKLQAERDVLMHNEFPKLPVKIRLYNFIPLSDYKDHIYREGSWSSWITVIEGSRALYETPSFLSFKKDLRDNPIPKEDLFEYLINKDKIELDGYFTRSSEWSLTKGMFSHIRRKLQILNYYTGHRLEFDYNVCLGNLDIIEGKDMLENLEDLYKNREKFSSDKEYKKYYSLAKGLTKHIKEVLR